MIDESEAERIAYEFAVRQLWSGCGDEGVAINDAATIEKPYGWLFACTTTEFLRTHDPADALIGAGPVLVLRENGRVIGFPSYHFGESALRSYEEELRRARPRDRGPLDDDPA